MGKLYCLKGYVKDPCLWKGHKVMGWKRKRLARGPILLGKTGRIPGVRVQLETMPRLTRSEGKRQENFAGSLYPHLNLASSFVTCL